MCGIAGYISDSHPMDKNAFKFFLDSMTHRGPDGSGCVSFNEGNVFLGHRRLAILDPSEDGRQPMIFHDGRLTITFNGEIYNFLELRKELQAFGYSFRTESDTEVILAAYSRWGPVCQFKFNGMWSFGIWDNKEKELFLSRDRFGVKPLFFLETNQRFLFASELKAFLKLPDGIRPSIDPGMFAFGKTIETAKKTILRNVSNLGGGHSILIRPGQRAVIKRWWRTSDHLGNVPADYGAQVDRFRELFLDACQIRMRSDVPLGTALSGGVDSSAVICGISIVKEGQFLNRERQTSDWRKAFVLDYASTAHSERKFAEEVVAYVGADPVILEFNPNEIDHTELEKVIYDFESIEQPAIGPWLIYREMRRRGIFVSLDGHGGDELLGGYFHYSHAAMMDGLFGQHGNRRWPDVQAVHQGLHQAEDVPDGFLRIKAPNKSRVIFDELGLGASRFLNKLISSGGSLKKALRAVKSRFLGRKVIDFWNHSPVYPVLPEIDIVPGFDRLNQALYTDFHFGMLPNILRNFDRLSMAHGVESRAPLLDWRLVTYAFSLPSNTKWGGGFTKRILRDAMVGRMPEAILNRKSKIGFASPMQCWLAGPLRSFVMDATHSVSFKSSDIWDGRGLAEFIEDAYRRSDYGSLEMAWPYLQASVLVNKFKSN